MAMRHWLFSVGASLVAHAALLAGLDAFISPSPVEQQPVPKSELTVTSYEVEQSEAAATTPEGAAAKERAPDAPKMGEGAIARSKVQSTQLDAIKVSTTPSQGSSLPASVAASSASATVTPVAPAAKQSEVSAPNLGATALPKTQTLAEPIQSAKLGAIATKAPSASALQAESTQTQSIALPAEISAALTPEIYVLPRTAPNSVAVKNAQPNTKVVTTIKPKSATLAKVKPGAVQIAQATVQMAALGDVEPQAFVARAASAETIRPPASDVPSIPAQQSAAPSQAALSSQAPSTAAPERDLPSEFATAALAWSGDEERIVDPVSLAAIQAFMQPSDLDTGGTDNQVRDGIQAVLASVPCSRLQTEFNPDTGHMQLRGHIPEDGLRAPILEALKAQVGTSIPIDDTLLILPRPQCGALSGIAEVGLPQSTDQITNPRVVGPQGFARNYSYSNGQRLILELGAPDYPSVVYVDYFTADGMVLHLQPNDVVPLERYAAKSGFTVGKERSDGPSLNLTISPPFGQEIAVAFAASVPVYDGLRPVSEPAEPYLRFLRSQITKARARDPDFKGEWVYFFISTRAE